jgi:hypothetical protein
MYFSAMDYGALLRHHMNEVIVMPDVILTNVRLCNNTSDGQERTYVANSGKLASVSDRMDLRSDSTSFERGSDAVQLDPPRVDGENGSNVIPEHPEG